MTRPVWSGAVSFGLVSLPVQAFVATRDQRPHFHRITRDSGARVRQENVAEDTGEPVERDEIELGYEIAKGRYVRIEPEELDALRPESTRAIEVRDFVPLDDIDPVYFQRTYWLAPDGANAETAYRLLLTAMEAEHRVGIGCFVMRRKAYLAAIRPLAGRLALTTMHFAQEVVAVEDVPELDVGGADTEPDAKALKLAGQIIGSLSADWEPEHYQDTYTQLVEQLVESKDAGEEVVADDEVPAPTGGKVLDLMAALRASVEDAESGGSSKTQTNKRGASSTKGTRRSGSSKRSA